MLPSWNKDIIIIIIFIIKSKGLELKTYTKIYS